MWRNYSKTCLRKVFNKVIKPSCEDILFKHNKVPKKLSSTCVILQHTNQQSEIKRILRHWPSLAKDIVIKQFINIRPAITFRRAASLKDKLVSSEFRDSKSDPCRQGGNFPLWCMLLFHIYARQKSSNSSQWRTFNLKHVANCHMQRVVCIITCDCGSFYIGKTKQDLWQSLYRHIRCMPICNSELSLRRHATKAHGGKFPKVKVTAFYRIHREKRGFE